MVDVYANEYFQIVKPDEGQLRKYQHLFSKYSKMYLIYNLLIYFPHLVYNFILNFCHCLFHYHSTFYAKNMSTPHSDFLIFSHLTKDNIDSSDDRFYGFIPRYLEIHGFPTSTFFSNHVRIRYSKLVKTASWLGKVNPILSPKSVQIFVFMRIFAKTLKTSLEIFIKGISGRNYSKEERLMLLEASRFQTNRTTLAVLFLLHHLIFAINKTGASRVLLSFEGHTYELYFAKMIRAYFPAIEINFYQYAPVVPMQFGLFHNLKAFPDNCQIWTSGEITKGIMIDAARNTKTKVRVLGSNKYLGFVNSKQYFPKDREVIKKKTILFAPEGNLHQSKEFLKLANLCCQKFPNLRFILRLHPSS
jgi:hypothetical protein